jgi:chorismate synthase
VEDLHKDLRRRKLGYGRGLRQKLEDDAVRILSGVRHGKTLGSPIALLIGNKDWKNWETIMQAEPFSGKAGRRVEIPRPGHADYTGGVKYDHADIRNVLERSSARETAMRVALAAVARKVLFELDIHVVSRVIRIGGIEDPTIPAGDLRDLNKISDAHRLRVLDAAVDSRMTALIDDVTEKGDTLGGIFEVISVGQPLGLGSYVQWDRRLEAEIGRQFLSLNAVKGVEIGLGFEAGGIPGSKAHDEFFPSAQKGRVEYKTNRSGGIDGGMSTGQPIVVRAAMKPLPTLMTPLASVRLSTGEAQKAHAERSDVCAVPAAAVIGESLLCFVLAGAVLEKFGGDSMNELKERVEKWRKKA